MEIMNYIIFNFILIVAIFIASTNSEEQVTSAPKITRDVKKSNGTKREIPKTDDQQALEDHSASNNVKAYYSYGSDVQNQNSLMNEWSGSYMNLQNNYMDNALMSHGYSQPMVHTQMIERIKPVPIVVDKKFNYPLASPVPVHIPQIIKVPVAQPYPVHIPVPQHVAVPVYKLVAKEVEKKVPYTVERPTPYIVEKPFKVEMKKYIPVHVKKLFPVYVPVYRHVIIPDKPKDSKNALKEWQMNNQNAFKEWQMNNQNDLKEWQMNNQNDFKEWPTKNQNEWSFNNYKGTDYKQEQPLYKYIDYKTTMDHGLDLQVKNNIWKNPSVEQDGSYIDNSGWQTTSVNYMPELYGSELKTETEGLQNYKTDSADNVNTDWQLENLKSQEYQTKLNANHYTAEESVDPSIKPITEDAWESSEAKFNKWHLQSSNEIDWKNNMNPEWNSAGATEQNSMDLHKYNLLPNYVYEEWKNGNIKNKEDQVDAPLIKGWKHVLIKKTVHWK